MTARDRCLLVGLASKSSTLSRKTYIVQRKDRFYVVAYDGIDALTGRERRRWHPLGKDRVEAEVVAARLDSERDTSPPLTGGPITVGAFLITTWLPQKRRHVRATTAYRYAWFVERYINPAIGDIPLRRIRPDHLDELYESPSVTGGRKGTGLAPKAVLEVHMMIMRSSGGAAASVMMPCLRDPTTGCSATHAAGSSTPSQSASSSAASCSALGLPRIRFATSRDRSHHDLRHTHASLLVAAGVPIKVVSERLGHAHPAFTMHAYQHLLPGMSAAAAEQFAALVASSSR